jgi:3-isopropylmalate/(R)-2-methylmalate dehydratase small subunit
MTIQGKVFYLDRPNVDTDQIIRAVYLTGVSVKGLRKHLFEGMPNFDREDPAFQEAKILVAGENFGCGSSREHAVWALEDHGFRAVIAPSFARIFRQNMFNRGLLPLEIPPKYAEELFLNQWMGCEIILNGNTAGVRLWPGIQIAAIRMTFECQISDFEAALIKEGGLVGFVAKRYPERVE